MVKTICCAALFIFLLSGCDFFIASAFPGYLPSVHRVANLAHYFKDSDFNDYDLFVIDDGPPTNNDFIFLLHKPSSTNRKVVVLDGKLDVVSEYEQANLGSSHTRFSAAPARAEVGSRSMTFDVGFPWDAVDLNATLASEKDYIMIFSEFTGLFYSFIINNGAGSQIAWTRYTLDLSSVDGSGSLTVDPVQYFFLENVGYAVNNTGDPNDDEVILFLRRQEDNEGIAVCIPANLFPDGGVATPLLSSYPAYYLGEIKTDSVYVLFGGMAVVMGMDDGTVKFFEYRTGIGFYEVNDINDEQFKKKVVAYSYLRPEFYVFDPKTKDIFKCGVWWRN
jgi:hypothetical protein